MLKQGRWAGSMSSSIYSWMCMVVPKLVEISVLNVNAGNTHLLRKGKYHCTADLLFDWLGFSRFVCV